jgi:hypothetical protein
MQRRFVFVCVFLPLSSVHAWVGKPGNTQIRRRPKYAEIPKNTPPTRHEAPRKLSDSTGELVSKSSTASAHTEYANTQAIQIRSNIQQYHTPAPGISHPRSTLGSEATFENPDLIQGKGRKHSMPTLPPKRLAHFFLSLWPVARACVQQRRTRRERRIRARMRFKPPMT